MKIVAVLYDGKELSSKTRQFLEENVWYNEDEGHYWLTKKEVLDNLNKDDEEMYTDIPVGWWVDAGFSSDQRKELEKLWSMGNSDIEARWEKL